MIDPEPSPPKRYCIISGTGRAGTTLLTRVFGRAGLDTGFDLSAPVDPVSHAGLERDLRDKPDCYIVKSPWIATYIEDVVSRSDIAIDHAVICVRDIFEAAESRRIVQALSNNPSPHGGLWETTDPTKQEEILAGLFYRLVFNLTSHDIPITFLHFPRFARDPSYFVEKLGPVFPSISTDQMVDALRAEVSHELITEFRKPENLTATRPPEQERADVERLRTLLVAEQEAAAATRESFEQERAEVERLRGARLELERHLDAMRFSKSWRVTAPLRAIARRLRRQSG